MAIRDYVIIDHVQAGQPRAYADSVYSAYITKRREGVLTNGGKFYIQLKEPDVREMARIFVRPFKDNPEYSLMAHLAEIRAEEPRSQLRRCSKKQQKTGSQRRVPVGS